ncbi:MAG: histidine kinase [Anaerolineales bacterium]|uniref:Histidine kinase n=1 Tax=Candidatus Desulfolinea nitratireducens TaxID=2841698 RepID=A0A8J6NRV8_9CHLR|nr:histidine kinase [Candidatus Desulfolinea nitratireducens]MBL6961403.1 histidine kinase [Anaerolineales bacterium]
MKKVRIKELEEKINELKERWPAHSTPPAMLQELDDLEEALALEIDKLDQKGADA